jgi:group I intron endonuclease
MISGVYCIKNKINNHIYIGSSTNIKQRFTLHRSGLNRGVRANQHLQSAWIKYSSENFEFSILLVCDTSMTLFYEQLCIDRLKPEYNICKLANKPNPRVYTIEQKKKVSQEHRGKTVSEETRKRINDSHKGVKLSDKHCESLRVSHLGYKMSNETKIKKSKTYFGLISPDGTIYRNITNLNEFIKLHNLGQTIYEVANGKKKQYKGWVLCKA